MAPTIRLDLERPAEQRWEGMRPLAASARGLIESYLRDLGTGGGDQFLPLLSAYRAAQLPDEVWAEIQSIASMVGLPADDVLVANLYYEVFRLIMGCTAFAVDTPRGPIHARNLDWWTESGMLDRETVVVEVSGRSAAGPFSMVGWPGFVGTLSGMAPGRFSVTVNAVLSNEPPQLAAPITFLVRDVLTTARDFGAAVERLSTTALLADCLMLVTGCAPGEMAVIERTSTRAAVRKPEAGAIVVTNEYRGLVDSKAGATESLLAQTASARYVRARDLVESRRPADVEGCLAILRDAGVRMKITVQHMVMQPSTGLLDVRLPSALDSGR
ncbi:MAG: C45 family autoproteolytic acyltransferase/hydrolase [Myxococcales bacterium]